MKCFRCGKNDVTNDIFCGICLKRSKKSPVIKKELRKIRSKNEKKLSNYKNNLLSNTTFSQSKALSIVRKISSMFNVKAKSEKVICNYIIDIFISKYNIGIEIDGSSHKNKLGYDDKRDNILKSKGIAIYRFKNSEINSDYFKKAVWSILMDKHLEETEKLLKIGKTRFDYISDKSWVALFY